MPPEDRAPPVIVAAAIVIEDDRVLLTRRPRGTHLADHWEFPGGKLEPGEAPADALVREMREETSVEITVDDVVDVTYWRYPGKDVLLIFYRAHRVDSSRPVANVGIADHVWARADELDGFTFPPADVSVVSKVRRLLRT